MDKQSYQIDLGNTRFAFHVTEGLYRERRDWNTAGHCNADYELHILVDGACVLDVDFQSFALAAGDAAVVAPGQYHMPQAVSATIERFSLPFCIYEGPLAAPFAQCVSSARKLRLPEQGVLLCREIWREMKAPSSYTKDVIRALLTQLMALVLRLLPVETREMRPPPSLAPDWRTDVIDTFFEQRFSMHDTAAQLAEQLHLSKRQLSRVLQTRYGMSFHEKLQHARMNHAAWLLRTTKQSVSTISETVGYGSQASFYKNFKGFFDMTPQQYRAAFLHPAALSER